MAQLQKPRQANATPTAAKKGGGRGAPAPAAKKTTQPKGTASTAATPKKKPPPRPPDPEPPMQEVAVSSRPAKRGFDVSTVNGIRKNSQASNLLSTLIEAINPSQDTINERLRQANAGKDKSLEERDRIEQLIVGHREKAKELMRKNLMQAARSRLKSAKVLENYLIRLSDETASLEAISLTVDQAQRQSDTAGHLMLFSDTMKHYSGMVDKDATEDLMVKMEEDSNDIDDSGDILQQPVSNSLKDANGEIDDDMAKLKAEIDEENELDWDLLKLDEAPRPPTHPVNIRQPIYEEPEEIEEEEEDPQPLNRRNNRGGGSGSGGGDVGFAQPIALDIPRNDENAEDVEMEDVREIRSKKSEMLRLDLDSDEEQKLEMTRKRPSRPIPAAANSTLNRQISQLFDDD